MSGGQRLSVGQIDPAAQGAVLGMEKYVRSSGLEPKLRELIKIRASQINGCAFCLDMHTRDAAKGGETLRRMSILPGWREASSLFDEREQAALALTEQMTLISQGGVSEEVWQQVRTHFDDKEIVALLMAISTINVWNRLAVTTHQDLPEEEQ